MRRLMVLGFGTFVLFAGSFEGAQRAAVNLADPSQLKLVVHCRQGSQPSGDVWIGAGDKTLSFVAPWGSYPPPRFVAGVLATEVDLTEDDATAKQILDRAAKFAAEKCRTDGTRGPFALIDVEVRKGDPRTFDERKLGQPIFEVGKAAVSPSGFADVYPLIAVEGKTRDVWLGQKDPNDIAWGTVINGDRARRDEVEANKKREALRAQQLAKEQEDARVREARAAALRAEQEARRAQQEARRAQQEDLAARQRESERVARQKEQADIRMRSASFVSANGVKHFVTLDQLSTNPFVYQNQVVAVYAVFEQMNSATEGLFFGSGDDGLVVTGIPPARFTKSSSMVMLAGRVLGKREVKLPLFGTTSVPHLAFVGSAFCQKQKCADYSITVK